jgi:hypothetical protein
LIDATSIAVMLHFGEFFKGNAGNDLKLEFQFRDEVVSMN